jgi:uncharacterized protein with FMN-binding domain
VRRVILAIAGTAVALVLLLTFKTSTQPAAPGSSPAAAAGSPTPGGPGSGGAAKTVTGKAWPTIYGPVQVRVTVSGGRVTAVTATEYPTGTSRDAQINAFAIPELNAETLKAGDAGIDTVSGATYTSQGYRGSLQSALDQADRAQVPSGASPSSTGTSSGSIG